MSSATANAYNFSFFRYQKLLFVKAFSQISPMLTTSSLTRAVATASNRNLFSKSNFEFSVV